MAEEVTQSVGAEGQAPTATEPIQETTPAAKPEEGEKGQEHRNPEHIPYERFREVNEERKQYKAKIEEYEKRFRDMETKSKPEEKAKANTSEYFKKKGYDDQTAQALGETMDEILNDRLQPINQIVERQKVRENIDKIYDAFASKHDDSKKYEPQMYKILLSLPIELQGALASDPIGLELLYAKAKEGEEKDLYEKGKEDVLKNVKLKKEGASLKGASVGSANSGKLTMEDINKMSEEDRRANWGKMIETYQNKGE